MRRFVVSLTLGALLFGDPFSLWNPVKKLWAQKSIQFSVPEAEPLKKKIEPSTKTQETIKFRVQMASLSTLAAAQKEIQRLKSANIHAQYVLREDKSNKKWFVIYTDQYKSKEEAILRGNQLIKKGVIKTFKIFPQKVKEERPPRAEELSASSQPPSKKEPLPAPVKSPVYFGPIMIKEEEDALRINIFLDQKIFPEITADKIADGSRLIATFKNIDKYIVPLEFDKVQSKTLLSFSLDKKGPNCILVIVLSPTYNYEVSQNYYEKEKIYSLTIGKGPTTEPDKTTKE